MTDKQGSPGYAEQESQPEDRERAANFARLNSLGDVLIEKRKESIEFREQSGIEDVWREDREYKEGIDDLNRSATLIKPRTSEGRVTSYVDPVSGYKGATIFMNITQPYVDMAASSIADMLLPTDDIPFSIEPTPIPELTEYEGSEEVQTFQDGTQIQAKDLVKMIQEKAAGIAERSETRIWDWLLESKWHAEDRKLIEDAACIGTGVLKGPYPYYKKTQNIGKDDEGLTYIEIGSELQPRSKCIKAENLFPNKSCGENIHNGEDIWERDYISKKSLLKLKDQGYLEDQIDAYLDENPEGSSKESKHENKKMHEIWYYSGELGEEDMKAAGCPCGDEDEDQDEESSKSPSSKKTPVIVTMVGKYVINIARSPLDSGEFIYDVLTWQRKEDHWAGTGVARQIRPCQEMLNAALRTELNNSGLASGAIWFFDRDNLSPAEGEGWGLTPNKMYFVDSSGGKSVRDCLHYVLIPNLQEKFAAIIQQALDFAERVTSMPLQLQGQQGAATETVGGMQLLQNNSNSTRRRIAKLFDDNITIPHIKRYYEWLLLYGDDPEEKGDSSIIAKGSTTFFERDSQNMALLQMAELAKDPESDIDFKKWVEEFLRAQKIDPTKLKYTDEEREAKDKEQAALQAQEGQGQAGAGQAEAAMIRADTEIKKATMSQESKMQELRLKEGIEAEKSEQQTEEAALDRAHEKEMKQLDYQIKLMEYSESRGIKIEELKTALTKVSMELNVQKELSAAALAVKAKTEHSTPKTQAATPPTEPAGRAPNTQAYSL
jgi:hypothetical protein